MNTNYVNLAIGITSVVISGVALIVSAVSKKHSKRSKDDAEEMRSEVKQVCKNLNESFDDLSKKDIKFDISDAMIDMVAKDTIEKEVSVRMRNVVDRGLKLAESEFKDAVSREINTQYDDIKGSVKREVTKQIGSIDINGVKREVIAEARDMAQKKFRDELDNELEKFNRNLDDVGKIYTSIAKKFKES